MVVVVVVVEMVVVCVCVWCGEGGLEGRESWGCELGISLVYWREREEMLYIYVCVYI